MTFVQAPKLLLALVLILTVVPKVLSKVGNDFRPPEAETRTIAFLSHNGFEAHGEQRRFGRLVYATSGDCRLRVLEVDPSGVSRDSVRFMAAPADRIIFIFNGKVYSDQPVVLTFLWSSWTSLRNRVGLQTSPKTILGVAASQACSLDELPWREVA